MGLAFFLVGEGVSPAAAASAFADALAAFGAAALIDSTVVFGISVVPKTLSKRFFKSSYALNSTLYVVPLAAVTLLPICSRYNLITLFVDVDASADAPCSGRSEEITNFLPPDELELELAILSADLT